MCVDVSVCRPRWRCSWISDIIHELLPSSPSSAVLCCFCLWLFRFGGWFAAFLDRKGDGGELAWECVRVKCLASLALALALSEHESREEKETKGDEGRGRGRERIAIDRV